MPGHIAETNMDALIRFRVPPELKRRLQKVATLNRKADLSEFLRDVLWREVERQDPVKPAEGAQLELSEPSGGAR
ncbi:MAG TPA: hypothetical protein VEB66_04910 [Opitutaceae bacterium]|nr:hypothetical protein [Opitutaceae bacterium]